MGIIITIILAISAAVSFGAEKSLPGDALYPIKTEVNETIEHWLAISPQAEADLSAKLAHERLAEAQKLKAEGKLDTETKVLLATDFNANEEKTDQVLRADIESSLAESGNILDLGLSGSADADAEAKANTNK